MKVCLKLWLESDEGELIMGDGRLAMLRAVERSGSLSAAARELGMSFRSLWGKVRVLEKRLGLPLVSGTAGGSEHGGATVSPEAKQLLAEYDRFTAAVHGTVATLGEPLLKQVKELQKKALP